MCIAGVQNPRHGAQRRPEEGYLELALGIKKVGSVAARTVAGF